MQFTSKKYDNWILRLWLYFHHNWSMYLPNFQFFFVLCGRTLFYHDFYQVKIFIIQLERPIDRYVESNLYLVSLSNRVEDGAIEIQIFVTTETKHFLVWKNDTYQPFMRSFHFCFSNVTEICSLTVDKYHSFKKRFLLEIKICDIPLRNTKDKIWKNFHKQSYPGSRYLGYSLIFLPVYFSFQFS